MPVSYTHLVARSTQVLAPISTLSSMMAIPICGIFSYPSGEGANPNPSAPITQAACRVQWLSLIHICKIVSCNGLYEGMMDDAINVHGTYLKVVKRVDDRTLVGRYMHGQSWGCLLYTSQ